MFPFFEFLVATYTDSVVLCHSFIHCLAEIDTFMKAFWETNFCGALLLVSGHHWKHQQHTQFRIGFVVGRAAAK